MREELSASDGKKTGCPVCGALSTRVFLTRKQIPVSANVVSQSREAAKQSTRGDLEITVCETCGFIHNAAFQPMDLRYDQDYDNSQTSSLFFNDYIDELARYLIERQGIRGCQIVEVGCGKGFFLRKMVEPIDAGNTGWGFDTSYMGPEVELDGRLRFEKNYYLPDLMKTPADAVICRHVIEHVADPMNLLRTIRKGLMGSAGGRVFIETPCVEWILSGKVIWDFAYEHCSYFTAASLKFALEKTGFKVDDIRQVFGGQYLWAEATADKSHSRQVAPQVDDRLVDLTKRFLHHEEKLKKIFIEVIKTKKTHGNIAIWGAGGKGMALANLVDPAAELLDCLVDLNVNKQGGFTAGSGHPIVSYRQLAARGVTAVIVMNPNYRQEIAELLRAARIDMELVDLMDKV